MPYIVSRFRGFGLDTLENPIDSALHSDIANLSDEKARLSRELVMFLYSGNSNFNWEKYIEYKKLIFDNNKSSVASSYSKMFNDLLT